MGYGTTYDSTIYDAPTFTGAQTHGIYTPPDTPDDPTNPAPPSTPGDDFYKVPKSGVYTDTTGYIPPPPPRTTSTTPTTPTTPGTKPTLNTKDVSSVDAYLAYMGAQPGINPSVKNDPNYWRQKLLSGELGQDESYISQRMFQAEGAPAAGGFDLGNFNLGNLFDDPAAAALMNILGLRMGQLTTPINDPNAALVSQSVRDALMHLQGLQNTPVPALPTQTPVPALPSNQPQLDAIMQALEANRTAASGPTQQYRDTIASIVQQLSQPAFTDDQLAQLKTAAVDTLEHEHQQAVETTVRAMGQRGIPPSSGLVQEAVKNTNEHYQTLKAQALQAQNVEEIRQVNERRQQLLQAATSGLTAAQQDAAFSQNNIIAQLNALMGQRQQDIALRGQSVEEQNAAQNLLLNQRAQDINLRGQDIAQTTTGVTLAQALEQLSRSQRAEQNANLNQAVQYAGIPVDLSAQRLSQALQVLGLGAGSTSPANLLDALGKIAAQATSANSTSNAASAAMWQQIGNFFAGLNK